MHFLRTSLACVALLVAACAARAPAPLPEPQIAGTWLLEPEDFQLGILAGIEVPAFALLAIRPDGRFTLYRGYPSCEPLRADGEMVSEAEAPLEYVSLCSRAAARAKEDGLNTSTLWTSAAGRWHIDPRGRLLFASESISPVPRHARDLDLARMRAKMEKDIRDAPHGPAAAIFSRLQPAMDRHGHRLGTFFTTFFVFDGLPIVYSLNEPLLRFTADRDATLTYRRYRPETLDTALAVSAMLMAHPRYLRCLLARVESEPPQSEFGRFVVQARSLAPALERYQHASLLRKAGRDADAERVMPRSQEQAFSNDFHTLMSHPAKRADLFMELGKYLGCPEAD